MSMNLVEVTPPSYSSTTRTPKPRVSYRRVSDSVSGDHFVIGYAAVGIRAHAAFGVVKDATLAALATAEGQLTARDRSELLAAALRALSGEGRPARP